jgi:RNA polymerase sigma-70 factor (ECF subfamily)
MEENGVASRMIQHESMTSGTEEIGEHLVALLPRLRRFARSLSRNQHDADDLVQSVVERAWRNLGQLKPGAHLGAWMFGIMKNAWIDDRRAHARRGEVALPEDSGLVLVEGMSYKEAAAVLEIPIGTLTSRLARGRTALAAALGDAP